MMEQFKKLLKLYHQATPHTKGQKHRHLIGMRQRIRKHITQIENCIERKQYCDTIPTPRNTQRPLNDGQTLSRRYLDERKRQQLLTRKKMNAHHSLNEDIYKQYYLELLNVTKMRPPECGPSYTIRAKERSVGNFSGEKCVFSYEEKFRMLVYTLKTSWISRDYIQRKYNHKSMFSGLCTEIINTIKKCASVRIDRKNILDLMDNLFVILRQFKRKTPILNKKNLYSGGGCKKHSKPYQSGARECNNNDKVRS